MTELHLWFKWLHVVSVVSWMAGLLYLPRLFVYHARHGSGSAQAETFKTMERRLYRIIATPAMLLSWASGLALIFSLEIDFHSEYWIWVKLSLISGLSAFHWYLGMLARSFARDVVTHSPGYFRILNEVPTAVLLLAAFLVIFKPF